MLKAIIKGVTHLYLKKDEPLPARVNEAGVTYEVQQIHDEMLNEILKSDQIRILITPLSPLRQRAVIQLVYWYDGTDATITDAAMDTENTRDLFDNTVVLIPDISCCTGDCGKCFYTLLMSGANLSTEPPELNWDKIKNNNVTIKDCPNCGGSFRQPVILIIADFQKK